LTHRNRSLQNLSGKNPRRIILAIRPAALYLGVMDSTPTTERPKVQRTYVTLKDPESGETDSFTV
jgi:hypothetical protein